MQKPILAWMNCYGSWAPELRQPIETIGYNEYLNAVVDALVVLKDRVEVLYVSGGMYDQNGKTECETTIPELIKRLQAKGVTSLEIIADEKSVTSITIVKTFLTVWQEKYQDHLPILFTDEARYATNAYTLRYFSDKFGLQIPPIGEILIPIPRKDCHQNSTPEKQAEKLRLLKEQGVEEVERMEMDARKEHLKS